MTITLTLSAVDGETYYSFVTPYPIKALEFLHKEDHEGASVHITLSADNGESYAVLALLKGLVVSPPPKVPS